MKTRILSFVYAVMILSVLPALSNEKDRSLKNEASNFIGVLPVRFLENAGQMTDMDHQPVPYVLFKAESEGMNLYVTDKGLTYVFLKYEEEEEFGKKDDKEKVEVEWKKVNMLLKGAQITRANCIKEGASKNYSRYYLPHCPQGIEEVRSFEKLTFREVYPGIDWVLYNSSKSGFKFDFVVHPGADPAQVKIIYEGCGKFELLKDRIHFSNAIGEVLEGELLCYQGAEKRRVGSNYKIAENKYLSEEVSGSVRRRNEKNLFSYEVSVEVEGYNKHEALIIDPLLTWASFCSGSGLDGAMTLATDPSGNVFISGYMASTDLPVLNPGGGAFYQGTVMAFRDCFVMKFSNAGVLLWSTYFGGSNYDEGSALCTDPAGNVFVTGNTNSTDLPTQNPGNGAYFQASNNGSYDAFVSKFSNTGTLLWSTYYGGGADDEGNSICTDPQGNPVIAGQTKSSNLPTFAPGGGGYYQPAAASSFDGFILKFTNAGVQTWGTYIGGSGFDYGNSVCTDANGNIFLVGETTSNNFPTLNPGGGAYFQGAVSGVAFDVYVSKFTGNGVQLWSTLYGGTGTDEGLAVVCDPAGNVFVSGESSHASFPTYNPGGGAFFQSTFGGGNSDGYMLKFSNTGTRLWATLLGGSGDEGVDSHKTLAADDCGNIYVTFNTTSPTMPVLASCNPGHYFDNTNNGNREIFISKFSGAGVQTWGTYFSGSGDDLREAIDLDQQGNLFICGEWTQQNGNTVVSNTYPVITPGGSTFYQPNFMGGLDDSFIAKFDNVPVSSTATSTPDACVCNGTATASGSGGCPGYQYTWYSSSWTAIGNTPTISNLCGGVYHVLVRDSVNCTAPDTSTTTVASTGGYVNLAQNVSICAGSSYILPGGTVVVAAGAYVDTLAIVPGCDTIMTTNLNLINTFTSTQSVSICSGNTYTLPGGSVVSVSGVYSDTLSSVGGCDSVIATNLAVVNALFTVQNPVICTGNTFTLPGGQTVSVSGTYKDTLTSSGGCDSIITTNLSVVPTITHSQSITLCPGTTFTLPGGVVISTSGTYLDTLVSSGGCDSIITTQVNVLPPKGSTQSPVICSDSSFVLPSGATVAVAGTYLDTLVSASGCDSIVTTNLTVNPAPTAVVSAGTSVLYGTSTTLVASGGNTYVWSPVAGLNNTTGSSVIAHPTASTVYCVTVTNSNGCTDVECISITVEIICGEFYLPNAFSPNEDNENEVYKAYINPLCVSEFQLVIYNRWGESVFETSNVNEGWNGEIEGKISNTAVYAYFCRAKLNTGVEIVRKGNISLIR